MASQDGGGFYKSQIEQTEGDLQQPITTQGDFTAANLSKGFLKQPITAQVGGFLFEQIGEPAALHTGSFKYQ